MNVVAHSLTAEAFAPFGEVLTPPREPGRDYFERALGNTRPNAWPSLSITHTPATTALPFRVELLERHAHSSQSFVPLDVSRWLIMVAPSLPEGGPDVARLQAFLAGPHHGITLAVGTWHHGLTVLDRDARFAIFMWRDGTAGDEAFVKVDPVVLVEVSPRDA